MSTALLAIAKAVLADLFEMIASNLWRACAIALFVALCLLRLWADHAITAAHHERDTARTEHAWLIADLAAQRAQFEAAARERDRAQHDALAVIRTIYEKELADAHATATSVAAGLRADALRLRGHWQGCLATADLSQAAATAARADDAAELRAASAGRIIGAGAEADVDIRALQQYVTDVCLIEAAE